MIIQGGMVFKEDGSFRRQELYIEGPQDRIRPGAADGLHCN